MAYWLIKSEPDTWSWDQQVKKGAKGDSWTGVRNFQARTHLQNMKKGDRAFFYHTGDEKAVVGVAEVIKEAYPDPTADAGSPWVCVDVIAKEPLKNPVTLEQAKTDPALKDMSLVTSFRLSVQPVTAAEWRHVCKLGGVKG